VEGAVPECKSCGGKVLRGDRREERERVKGKVKVKCLDFFLNYLLEDLIVNSYLVCGVRRSHRGARRSSPLSNPLCQPFLPSLVSNTIIMGMSNIDFHYKVTPIIIF